MDWILSQCIDKMFWHITTKENISKINHEGLKQSFDGQNGKGVYCIETNDYDVLDGIIELMAQRNISIENLAIIEFSYSGEFEFCKKHNLILANEGWVVIRYDIDTSNIKRIFNVIDS